METTTITKAAGKPVKKESLGETIRFILFLFVAALLLRTFIIAPFNIPSGSMLPRMMIGDYLFVAKWPYGFSRHSMPFGLGSFEGRFFDNLPERGDVAVFRHPRQDVDLVKRVIGLPGDVVELRGGQVILNGRPVARSRVADYLMPITPNSPCRTVDPAAAREVADAEGMRSCAFPRYRETLPGGRSYFVLDQVPEGMADSRAPLTVPAGHVFVMGDNRDDSQDSRFPQEVGGVGFLPTENLIGGALITFFSTDGSASWVKPWTWVSAARADRIGGSY